MSTESDVATYVLVVEDDDDVRDLLVRRIEKLGHHVLQAESGEHALEVVKDHTPALVVLDIKLPGIDGWAVLHKLRGSKATANVPVLVVSILDTDAADGHPPIDGYIVKPFRASAIDDVVENLLEGRPQ